MKRLIVSIGSLVLSASCALVPSTALACTGKQCPPPSRAQKAMLPAVGWNTFPAGSAGVGSGGFSAGGGSGFNSTRPDTITMQQNVVVSYGPGIIAVWTPGTTTSPLTSYIPLPNYTRY